MFLKQIGADARVEALFQALGEAGQELARISFESHDRYRLWRDEGESEAVPAGRLRRQGERPAVGDWVLTDCRHPDLAVVEAILPRRTWFSRRAAGRVGEEQAIAANVDLAVVVCGLDGDFNLRRLERYLVLAMESGAETLIVLNKADLCTTLSERIEAVGRLAPAADMLAMSALASVEPLCGRLRNRTAVLLGSSGAGKSTIVNGLLGESLQTTAQVRPGDDRGRHTTTGRMLLPLPGGGAVIDTPGMRELQLWAGEESLEGAFPEVAALAAGCRFRDCTHSGEPACAVSEAIERGALDERRWQSYRKLQREIRHTLLEQDARASAAEKNRNKTIHRAMRQRQRFRDSR